MRIASLQYRPETASPPRPPRPPSRRLLPQIPCLPSPPLRLPLPNLLALLFQPRKKPHHPAYVLHRLLHPPVIHIDPHPRHRCPQHELHRHRDPVYDRAPQHIQDFQRDDEDESDEGEGEQRGCVGKEGLEGGGGEPQEGVEVGEEVGVEVGLGVQEEALEGEEVGRVGLVVVVVEGEGLGGVSWMGVGLALGTWK